MFTVGTERMPANATTELVAAATLNDCFNKLAHGPLFVIAFSENIYLSRGRDTRLSVGKISLTSTRTLFSTGTMNELLFVPVQAAGQRNGEPSRHARRRNRVSVTQSC